MKKRIFINATGALALLYFFNQCNSGTSLDNSSIPIDSATIAAGETSFIQYCSGCHNFKRDGIGPHLGGLTTKVSVGWIQHFIKDPQQMISSGDGRAGQLFSNTKKH